MAIIPHFWLRFHENVDAWANALRRPSGSFLYGLSVGDSPAFDHRLLLKDEERRRSLLGFLGLLTSRQIMLSPGR
jgi:hypothetical protein